MVIDRSKHNKFVAKPTYTGTTTSTQETSSGVTNIFVTGGGGSGGGSLSGEQLDKLNSIEYGAQVNQDAYSYLQTSSGDTSITQKARNQTDTAKLTINGVAPITVNLTSKIELPTTTATSTGTNDSTWVFSYKRVETEIPPVEEGGEPTIEVTWPFVMTYTSGTRLLTTDFDTLYLYDGESVVEEFAVSNLQIEGTDVGIDSITIVKEGLYFDQVILTKTEVVEEQSVTTNVCVFAVRVEVESIYNISGGDSYWILDEEHDAIYTKYNVYSMQEVAAYGYGSGGPGGEGGASYIKDLLDVNGGAGVNPTQDDMLLMWDSTLQTWQYVDKNSVGLNETELANYLTQNEYVQRDEVADLIKEQLDKIFRIIYAEDGVTIIAIEAMYDFYSVGEVTAYGYGASSGGSVTALSDLSDVDINSLQYGDILFYNGSKWINYPGSNIGSLDPDSIKGGTNIEVVVNGETVTINNTYVLPVADNDVLGGIKISALNDATLGFPIFEVESDGTLDIADTLKERILFLLELWDMFEWDKSASETDSSLWLIKAKRGMYSVGEVTAYGVGEEGGQSTGAQYLYELKDVNNGNGTNPGSSNMLLMWNGSTWAYIDRNDVGLNTDELQNWLEQNNYLTNQNVTWDIIRNKPTTLAGYGITDGVNALNITGTGNAFTSANISGHTLTINKNYTFAYANGTNATGTWPINISGNAATASRLDNAITLTLNGSVTGSASIDGSGNVTLTTTYTTSNISALDGRYVNITGDTMTGDLSVQGDIDSDTLYVTDYVRIGNVYLRYDSSNHALYVEYVNSSYEANFYAEGEVSAYGMGDTSSGGLDETALWAILSSSSPDQIHSSHLTNALSGYATQSWVLNQLDNIDVDLTDYVTTNTTQTITGVKTFSPSSGAPFRVNSNTVVTNLNADLLDGLSWDSFRLQRAYTISLSGYSSSNFYPIFFGSTSALRRITIRSQSGQDSAPYNCNWLDFIMQTAGWDDTGKKMVVLSRWNYSNSEITIGSVGYGNQGGGMAIWVRGGLTYYVHSTEEPQLKVSSYTYNSNGGTETYTVGTNYYGGSNNNVTICWTNNSSGVDDKTVVKFEDLTWSNISTSTVGSSTRPIYFSSGVPTQCAYNLSASVNSGTSGRLAYYSSSTAIDDYASTIGSSTRHMYISNGIPTVSSSNIGNSQTPLYMSGGIFTACSDIMAQKLSINPSRLQTATYGNYGGILQLHGASAGYGLYEACPTSAWYNIIKILHNNTGGYYTELAQSFLDQDGLWFRSRSAGNLNMWQRVTSEWRLGAGRDGRTQYVVFGPAYNSSILKGFSFSGILYIKRGSTGEWHGETSVFVNVGAQYNNNIASYIIMEGQNNYVNYGFYRIYYNGGYYIAYKISQTSSQEFRLVGTAYDNFEPFLLSGNEVSNETALNKTDTANYFGAASHVFRCYPTGGSSNIYGARITADTSYGYLQLGCINNSGATQRGRITGYNNTYMTDMQIYSDNFRVRSTSNQSFGVGLNSMLGNSDVYIAIRTSSGNPYLGIKHGGRNWFVQGYNNRLYIGPGAAVSPWVDSSGNFVSQAEITAYSTSDIRFKQDLVPLKALDKIRNIGVYEYDWTDEAMSLRVRNNRHDYGIIAQELVRIIPEAVTDNMFGKGYLGIDYTRLVPFAIQAVKEVDDEVTKLKKRVKRLETRLSKYEHVDGQIVA